MTYSDEFLDAVEVHAGHADMFGEGHPITRRALEVVMDLAPREIREAMHAKATELGLIPPAAGFLEDGTQVYRLEDIAKRMGLSEEDAQRSVARFMQEREAAGLPSGLIDPSRVHLKQ